MLKWTLNNQKWASCKKEFIQQSKSTWFVVLFITEIESMHPVHIFVMSIHRFHFRWSCIHTSNAHVLLIKSNRLKRRVDFVWILFEIMLLNWFSFSSGPVLIGKIHAAKCQIKCVLKTGFDLIFVISSFTSKLRYVLKKRQ